MRSMTREAPAATVARPITDAVANGDRARRRAERFITVITLVSATMVVDFVLAGHTIGDEIWGPITAAMAALTGALSFIYLAGHSRNRAANFGLIAVWLTVAFFGFGGYQSHRLPLPEGTVDSRPRPPLSPLIFTGIGIAGAINLRSGSKGSQS